ncbi:MAG: rhomboid family intramembrane serine protease [Bacteroidales bacterium]|nr:rhomboid family intramembrane serine protease [Bacteroidales bacterium]
MNFGQIQIPPAVKNILIINILVFAASYVFGKSLDIDLNSMFGLHYYQSENFGLWQFVTYMFLHADITHIFFNMFAVFQFGRLIEQYWGTNRFLIYYFVTGIGAGLIQEVALYFDIRPFIEAVDTYLSNQSTESLNDFLAVYGPFSQESLMSLREFTREYNAICNSDIAEANRMARDFIMQYQAMYIDAQNTIGASGAVFGILLAFGMMFPNLTIMLLIPPIPLKAKYFVVIYGLIELFEGVANFSGDNVAHWAHLGGMIFGFILIRRWRREGEL